VKIQRGHKGVHFIVQHKLMGRKHMKAAGTVATLQHMIGKPYGVDAVIIGVVDLGKPVPDNEPMPYRANRPVKTRRVDNLPSCVKRLESPDVEVTPPSLRKVKGIGYQPCHGAAVARGEAFELSYEERKANAGKFRPAAVYPQQSSPPTPPNIAIALIERDLYRDHAWLRMQEWPPCVEPPKVWHDGEIMEVYEDCMDNPGVRPDRAPSLKDKPLIKGYVKPEHYTLPPKEIVEEDILTRVQRILGKV